MRTSMDMLNGSLWDKIFKFSMPVAATAILEQFFTATDVVIDYFSVLGPSFGL